MKRIISLAVICLSVVQLIAQNLPQGIAYQAVAVKDGPYSLAGQNPQAIYWSNKDIKVRFTIYEKYPGGSTQYSEFHATKTDDYGVFNLIIGQGNPISGDFTKIPWDLGTAHLQVEIDFDNNGTYKLTSLERFWSVPYAFVTRKSSSNSTDSALSALNSKFNYLKNRDKDTVIGNEGGVSYKSLDSLNKVLIAKLAALKASDKDTVIGNEWQKLTRNKDTLILSDGGGKVTLLDEDPKNELQNLSVTTDSLLISNGNSVALKSLTKSAVSNNEYEHSSVNLNAYYTRDGTYNSIKFFETTSKIDSFNVKAGDKITLYLPSVVNYADASGRSAYSTLEIIDGNGKSIKENLSINISSISTFGTNKVYYIQTDGVYFLKAYYVYSFPTNNSSQFFTWGTGSWLVEVSH